MAMELEVMNHGLVGYLKAYAIQESLVMRKLEDRAACDYLIMLEHPAVVTLGKSADEGDIINREELVRKKIEIINTDRGGGVTFHVPGQLVIYPVMDLRRKRITVRDYVRGLESVVIDALKEFGVEAERNPLNNGVWYDACKIASIGIRLRRGISFHGIAVNVNNDTDISGYINPCGLKDIRLVSLKEITGRHVPEERFRYIIEEKFRDSFGYPAAVKTRMGASETR
ncbi:MAG: lipoyl(octanoyl) transferase LipB [Elusimicrobia bacterium]|nr:lipoyl(octanoyl) transferase LipB [Elusimicrobiota bacterium]